MQYHFGNFYQHTGKKVSFLDTFLHWEWVLVSDPVNGWKIHGILVTLMQFQFDDLIFQVLIDTRTIQKEINNLTGKLDRTFTVTDELIFSVS